MQKLVVHMYVELLKPLCLLFQKQETFFTLVKVYVWEKLHRKMSTTFFKSLTPLKSITNVEETLEKKKGENSFESFFIILETMIIYFKHENRKSVKRYKIYGTFSTIFQKQLLFCNYCHNIDFRNFFKFCFWSDGNTTFYLNCSWINIRG